MYCGKGVLYYANGDSFNGEWSNNYPHGEGTYRTSTGYLYSGSWVCGKVFFFFKINSTHSQKKPASRIWDINITQFKML